MHTFSVDHSPHLGQASPSSAVHGHHVPAEQQGRDEQVDPNIARGWQGASTEAFMRRHKLSLEGTRTEVTVSPRWDEWPLECLC